MEDEVEVSSSDDKENQPTTKQSEQDENEQSAPAAWEVLREERCKLLQSEVNVRGSTRVWDKQVTGVRQPLQTLHNVYNIR